MAGQEWQDTSRLAAPAVPCPYSLAPRSSLRRPTLSKRTRTTWERVAALWGRSSPDLSTFPLIHCMCGRSVGKQDRREISGAASIRHF